MDGFAIVEAAAAAAVTFAPPQFEWAPQILPGPTDHSRLLKYADAPQHYGIAWSYDAFQVREVLNSELDRFFRRNVQDHTSTVLRGDGPGAFHQCVHAANSPGAQRQRRHPRHRGRGNARRGCRGT